MARSLSFPVSTPRAQFLAAVKCRPSASSYQQRSVSLPVRLHPDNYSDARAAVRRRYEAGLAAAVRAQRKTEKELLKLAAATRNIGRSPPTPLAVKDAAEAEIAGIAWVAVEVAASASAAVFAGIGHLGSAAAAGLSTSQQTSCMVWAIMWRSAAFRKRMEKEMNEKEGEKRWKAAMKKMETTERCIAYVESWSHRTFRRMLNTRVFLLNALSPTL
ncbi:hypothetical protein AXF42_Ash009795 [Apostasia shenzhenica]|uniref:Uncharacterized protein n=1 Tax=Apostasia shenzhenica TaxID=1088818 RepID=A0A2I0AX38_9ASPA|nr:hypothetical protein AXF42_Ash009795 [Apostasia shenzhenica]